MKLIDYLNAEADQVTGQVHEYNTGKGIIKVPQLTCGQLIQISPILAEVVMDEVEEELTEAQLMDKLTELIDKYIEPICKVIKIVTNEDAKDLTPMQVYHIFMLILQSIDVSNFHKSIILMKRMSRITSKEIIAAQKSLTPSI